MSRRTNEPDLVEPVIGVSIVVAIIVGFFYLGNIYAPKPEIVIIDGCKYERYQSYHDYSLVPLGECKENN